ncbi:phage protein NinX family protein [Klebsiella michiganensis]|uniref:phage protein NinX family protein n=1 Tax=Klebsiella michiganensis TaxID=1134687 RepID=UPI003D9749EF
MVKVKTAELSGDRLDYFTAIAIGEKNPQICQIGGCVVSHGHTVHRFFPSSEWQHGGPLIEKYNISISDCDGEWMASIMNDDGDYAALVNGARPLIAACRAVVASKLGDEVDIPDELND